MNPIMFPLIILMQESADRRARVAQAVMPSLLPLQAAPRMAFAAIAADQSVRVADDREEQVVSETVTAVGLAQQHVLSDADFALLPVLRNVVQRRPSALTEIQAVASDDGASTKDLVDSVHTMLEKIAGGAQVTAADLKTPPFKPLADLLPAADLTAIKNLK